MSILNLLDGTGKKVVIFGINSTFGLQIETALLDLGFEVWGTYFHTDEITEPHRIKCDFRDVLQIQEMMGGLPATFDAIVNCAVPPYEDNDQNVHDLGPIYDGLTYAFEMLWSRLTEWGKIVHIGGQTTETTNIKGAHDYTRTLIDLHKWGMEFNEQHARQNHVSFVSYCLGMSETRELDTWSPEILALYHQKVPVFVLPEWLALSVVTSIAIPFPATKQVWNPNSYRALVVRP